MKPKPVQIKPVRRNPFLLIPLSETTQQEINDSWGKVERRIAKQGQTFKKREIFVVNEKGVATRVKVIPRTLRFGKLRKAYPKEFTVQALERLERMKQRKSYRIEALVRKLREKLETENPKFRELMKAVSRLQEEIKENSEKKNIRVNVEKTSRGFKISIIFFTSDLNLILRDLKQQIDVCKKIIELAALQRSVTYLLKKQAIQESLPKNVIDRIDGTLNFLSRRKSELGIQVHQFEAVKKRLEKST